MNGALQALRARWSQLASRERLALALMGVVVGAVALWMLALRPALRTIDEAQRQLDTLELQLQDMQRMAADAKALRATAPVAAPQAVAALKSATDRLGERAQLALQRERAVLTLSGVSSTQLRAWLAEARSGARARAIEARLATGPQGLSGTLVVAIPNAP